MRYKLPQEMGKDEIQEMRGSLTNKNIEYNEPLRTPEEVKVDLPLGDQGVFTVFNARNDLENILSVDEYGKRKDDRLIAIVGPCSIHNTDEALDYARKLADLAEELDDRLMVVMRTYFEKPRTTIGWKGLLLDPYLDGSYKGRKHITVIDDGIDMARKLLIDLADIGLPTGTEVLGNLSYQFFDDLITWASVGARSTEHQGQRECGSGITIAMGYKNGTQGDLQIAYDAIEAARHPHTYHSMTESGRVSTIRSKGNPLAHLVLRGGNGKPNYHPEYVEEATNVLESKGYVPNIVVDCSHANSNKKYQNQMRVVKSVAQQIMDGTDSIRGVMLESFINEGNQSIPKDVQVGDNARERLKYGVSVTDQCLSLKDTEKALRVLYDAVGARIQ